LLLESSGPCTAKKEAISGIKTREGVMARQFIGSANLGDITATHCAW
jgi:hypothetical protein